MRIPTLHQLRILQAVATEGSVSGAARALFLTQPTLSVQLRQLGETLGVALFRPHGRRLRLTDEGRDVLEAARSIDSALKQLETRLAARAGLQRGRLAVAAVSTAESFLPRLLGEFHRWAPGIEIALAVDNRAQVVERARQGLDDLYLMTRPPAEVALTDEAGGPNPLVVVAAPSHPLAVPQGPLTMEDLAGEAWVAREAGSGTRLWSDAWLAERGIGLRATLVLGSNEAVKQAVRGGFGLAILSAHCLQQELAAGTIRALDVAGFPIPSVWHLMRRAERPLSPVAAAFRDHFLGAMPRLHDTLGALLARHDPQG